MMETHPTQRRATPWRITLFGGLTVQYGNRSLSRFKTRRAASLLACLAFFRHRRHAREELIEMLWPDEDLQATRLRFRQVLTTLRKDLARLDAEGNGLLLVDRDFLSLDAAQVATDVADFEAALKRAARQETAQGRAEALAHAIQCYTAELLPGFYEDWVGGERRRLTESYLNALTELARTLAEKGEYSAAFDHTRKALLIDPLREESHCCLIQLYAAMGRNAEALRQYRELEQILWKELRLLPAASSQALIEQVRSGTLVDSLAVVSTPFRFPSDSVSPASLPEETRNGQSASPFISSPVTAPLAPFFGRETELAWLMDLLQPITQRREPGQATVPAGQEMQTRLITLTGVGGCGKTRLAQEAARRLEPIYAGAVYFIPLADKQPNALLGALTDAVCGPNSYTENLLQQTTHALDYRPTLLVLDNFEQMLPESSLVVRTLLERVPTLKCLITSRQRLGIEGEQEYLLSPLPIPKPTQTPEHLLEFASVQLFVDRAQRVRPGFLVDAQTAESIVGICAQLEGLPLALELAAAWMALLSPAQIQQRLKQRLDLLVSHRKDIPERHRSMRATLEWSYRNLPPELQRFFARLSVFHGGWTLEAAEAVCEAPQALEYLAELQQRSFVQAQESGAGMRFGMLELLREFAAEQLSSEEVLYLQKQHQAYFLDLAERVASQLTGADQREWLLRLKGDYENLRLLLAESKATGGDWQIGLRLFRALYRFWDVYAHYEEAEQWLQHLSERLAGIEPALKARVLEAAGALAGNRGQKAMSQAMLEEAVTLFQALGDREGVARTLSGLAITLRDLGDYPRARRLFEECLPALRSLGEPFTIGRALIGLGLLANAEGNYADARSLLDEGATMYRICGHKKGLCFCFVMEGMIAFERSDLETARAFLENGLQMARSLEDASTVVYALYNLAVIHYLQGDPTAAQTCCLEAIPFSVTIGVKATEAQVLMLSGDLACDRQDYVSAQRYYRDGLCICEIGDLTREAKSILKRIAFLEAKRGYTESAIRFLSAAAGQSEDYLGLPERLCLATQFDVEALRQQIGSEVFEKHWSQGSTRHWSLALQEAREAVTG